MYYMIRASTHIPTLILYYAELELFFEACDYTITEGQSLTRPIRLQFYGPTQNPFTATLSTTSIDLAEERGLGNFTGFSSIGTHLRATPGIMIIVQHHNFSIETIFDYI